MARVIVGVFPERASAEHAVADLKAAGFDPGRIGFITRGGGEAPSNDAGADAGTGGALGALVGLGIPREEADYYSRRARAGGALLTFDPAGREAEAREILLRDGAEDTWSTTPWAVPQASAARGRDAPSGGMPPRTGPIIPSGARPGAGPPPQAGQGPTRDHGPIHGLWADLQHGPAIFPDSGLPLPTEADLTERDREHAFEDRAYEDEARGGIPPEHPS